MSTAGVFLLLLLAILCGYVMGIYQRGAANDDDEESIDAEQDILKSLGSILRDDADAGLDQFIHRLDVSPATLDTHLAVGNLLRRKGEISRAIRVHQNLISRPSLSKAQQRNAQLELARDFAQAGLLDRAERLLVELFSQPESDKEVIAGLLVDIYQDEHEWQKAIGVVDELGGGWFTKLADPWLSMRAHFYCELAALSVAKGELLGARKYLKVARNQQKNLARSYLLLAEIEVLAGNYREATAIFESLAIVDSEYLYAGLPLLVALAKSEQQKASVIRILKSAWRVTGISAFLLEELQLEEDRSLAEQQTILIAAITTSPNLRLLDVYLRQVESDSEPIQRLHEPLQQFSERLSKLPHYRCSQCGFTGRQIHWLCPSCKTWGMLRPIRGMEGV